MGIINTEKTPLVRSPDYYVEPDLTEIINEQQKRLYEGEEKRKAAAEEQKQKDVSVSVEIPKPAEQSLSDSSEKNEIKNDGWSLEQQKRAEKSIIDALNIHPSGKPAETVSQVSENTKEADGIIQSNDEKKSRISWKQRKHNQNKDKRKRRAENSH